MTNRQKIEYAIVENGVRWATNILVELLGNYGTRIPVKAHDHLRAAVTSLGKFGDPDSWKETK